MKKNLFKAACVIVLLLAAIGIYDVPVSAAYSKSKSVTVTLTDKKPFAYYDFKAITGTKKYAKVKILNVKGKAKKKKLEWWIYYDESNGKGSLFYDLKTSKIKKGKVLKSENWGIDGSGDFEVVMPRGMKKLKIKITLYSVNGANTIQSFEKNKKNTSVANKNFKKNGWGFYY